MPPVIRPEPSPEERAAILAALEALLGGDGIPAAYRSGWRESGIRENLGDRLGAPLPLAQHLGAEDEPRGATVRPRS
jgi:hypothetical protein